MPEIREASANDIEQIISIHREAFPGFFLTSLGPAFLREIYTGFIQSDKGKLFIAQREGEILGFAAGTVDPDGFFKQIRKRRWPAFLLKAIPGLVKSPLFVIRKLWSAIRYSGDTPVSHSDGALLSSLAVSPRAQRQGTGDALVAEFCRYSAAHRKTYVYTITDMDENRDVVRFYEKLGFTVDAVITKQNNRRMYRLRKPLTQ
jgi:ribosomal protein S18 acetylase RimI-like enzyme